VGGRGEWVQAKVGWNRVSSEAYCELCLRTCLNTKNHISFSVTLGSFSTFQFPMGSWIPFNKQKAAHQHTNLVLKIFQRIWPAHFVPGD
jgi:hypothetical protein